MKRLVAKLPLRRASRLAFWGGVCLIVGGASGSATLYVAILAILARVFPAVAGPAALVATLLTLLAAFGGVTVLFGARALATGNRRVGLFLVDIGAGLGVVGVILIAASALGSSLDFVSLRAAMGATFSGVAGVGLALTLYVRLAT
ncbi:MAG: hypothetical protein ACYDCK_07450 [Thermoplasmatota archaeon]